MQLGHLPCALAIVALLSGCRPSLSVIVTVEPPPGAVLLEVLATVNGTAADQVPQVPVPASAAGRPFTFVLLLPKATASGAFLVKVGARDLYGCLLAKGVSQGIVSSDDAVSAMLTVSLAPLPIPVACGGTLPAILDVTPDRVPSGHSTMAHITGWGFRPQASVRVNSMQLAAVVDATADQVDVNVAVAPGVAGPLLVEVENPDGATARATSALAAFFEHVMFGPATTIYSSASAMAPLVEPVTFADVNGDGRLDLLAPSGTGIALALNQGDASFAPVVTIPTRSLDPITMVVAGDLNGDGRVDLVAASIVVMRPATLIVMLSADGSFPLSGQTALQIATPGAAYLKLVDLNKDGQLDLLLPDQIGTQMWEFLNQGHGTFPSVATLVRLSSGLQIYTTSLLFYPNLPVAIEDLNGDGLPDLAGVSSNLVDVLAYWNQGDGSFSQAPSTLYTGSNLYGVRLVGSNGRSPPGLMVLGMVTSSVLLTNDGKGGFDHQNLQLQLETSDAATADLNGDDRPDLVLTFGAYNMYPALDHGQFESTATMIPPSRLFADVTGDGKIDLVTIGNNSVQVLPNISN